MKKRNEIIEMATELFSSRGYRAVSIRCIADESGVKKTTLYYYFDSKEDLLIQVIQNNIDQCKHRIASRLPVSNEAFIDALNEHKELLVLSSIITEIYSVNALAGNQHMRFWSGVFCDFVKHVHGREGDLGLRNSLIAEFHGAVIMQKLGDLGIEGFCHRLRGLLEDWLLEKDK